MSAAPPFPIPGSASPSRCRQGFVIDNSQSEVTATGPGDMAVRFDGVALARTTPLVDYVRSGWVTGLDAASVRPTTINGSDAATARARADGWQFDITVIRSGDRVYRLLTAAPAASNALDPVARSVSGSFRALTAAEKASLKPLRIRVVDGQARPDHRLLGRLDDRGRS